MFVNIKCCLVFAVCHFNQHTAKRPCLPCAPDLAHGKPPSGLIHAPPGPSAPCLPPITPHRPAAPLPRPLPRRRPPHTAPCPPCRAPCRAPHRSLLAVPPPSSARPAAPAAARAAALSAPPPPPAPRARLPGRQLRGTPRPLLARARRRLARWCTAVGTSAVSSLSLLKQRYCH